MRCKIENFCGKDSSKDGSPFKSDNPKIIMTLSKQTAKVNPSHHISYLYHDITDVTAARVNSCSSYTMEPCKHCLADKTAKLPKVQTTCIYNYETQFLLSG